MLLSGLLWLLAFDLVISNCTTGDLGGVPADGWTCSLQSGGTGALATFAETVVEFGDCSTYSNKATLIGPFNVSGIPTSTFFGNATLTNNTSAVILYTGAVIGAMDDGKYSMTDLVTFGNTTQTWLAHIFITHSDRIITTPATSTITISSTQFITETGKSVATNTPTTVLYKFITVTSTVSCLNFAYPTQTAARRRQLTLKADSIDVQQGPEFGFVCFPQGVATLYTTTILSTVTKDVTETVFETMPPVYGGDIVFQDKEKYLRPTVTVLSTVTITVREQASTLTQCD